MSTALAARLLFAVFAAIVGAVFLVRSLRNEYAKPEPITNTGNDVALTCLRWTVLCWCAVWALAWLTIAFIRLKYPFELEWASGSMLDHCERVLAGRPLYLAPGPEWFPFEYPPLYFWISALVMRLMPDTTFTPLRLVSIASTLGCAGIMFAWVRQACLGARGRTWGWIAAGIFIASYRFTGAWYDIERLDMLFLVLSLSGGWMLSRAFAEQTAATDSRAVVRSNVYLLLSAVAFWFAFLTKQQAVLFIVGSLAALAVGRRWRHLVLFTAISAALCFGSVALLNQATSGFTYYCFRVPMANGIKANLAAQYFITDLPLYAPLIALIAVSALKGMLRLKGSDRNEESDSASSSQLIPAAAWCLMGLGGSLLSRAHWGGDQNVLMAGFIGLTLLACMLAAAMETRSSRIGVALYALALAQLITLVYRPDAQIPTAASRSAGEKYQAKVRELEKDGEVLCLDHGHMSSIRHFHLMGMLDVVGFEKELPGSVVSALRSHRYAAILSDAKPEPTGALAELARTYQVEGSLHLSSSWIATGFPTPAPGREVWVLRPR